MNEKKKKLKSKNKAKEVNDNIKKSIDTSEVQDNEDNTSKPKFLVSENPFIKISKENLRSLFKNPFTKKKKTN